MIIMTCHKKAPWYSFPIRSDLHNGLACEAIKQHRSISNMAEHILKEAGIREMTDEDLEKEKGSEEIK